MKVITGEWLERANDDLRAAELLLQQTELSNIVAFHAQQAVEKYLKGFLVAFGIKPKKIHTTATLTKQCAEINRQFRDFVDKCKMLDRYYIPPRYPVGPVLTYRKEEAQKAIETMEEIINIIKEMLEI